MTDHNIFNYERNARTSLQYWALLALGLFFAWAGSTIDPLTNCSDDGECAPWLVWWQNRLASGEGDAGRIHPSRISKIRIVSDSDSDAVHLYDLNGERQPFFDTEVIPWPYDKWADGLAAQWPHIQVEKN